MQQLCGPLVRELFIEDDEEIANILKNKNKITAGKEIELSLVDLQWLQVFVKKT